ncbi:MAG TPA: tRNA lysidine(34) synthetase TilS [Acidobacteriaceae bacterium]|jgi:tRNA(Ile)-lysidine synthase|nr:tRNA lysidine(34) synthetase TilS [Acidobacteriaceae bacterium]
MCAKSTDKSVLPFDRSLFQPGQRVCVAVSGGADSTALLRTLFAARQELGIVLSVVHVQHGIRGADADADAAFVVALAAQLGLPCEVVRVDTPAYAAAQQASLETAARNLRYGVFWDILQTKQADVLTTAHTLDDQAETVLMKLLRGAWTEGLSGIHPVLLAPEIAANREVSSTANKIVRPLLAVRRVEIEAYLRALGQTTLGLPWCEDASNRDLAHTRNRVRHHLLPLLREFNPGLEEQLARMATLARDEEAYWQGELARILPGLLLPGKPVRGGGRSVSTEPGHASLAVEVQRLRAYGPAVRRRVLRAAAEQLSPDQSSGAIDFDHTESLLRLLEGPATGATRRLQLAGGLHAERSARELRLERIPLERIPADSSDSANPPCPEYSLPVPGSVDAVARGLHFTATVAPSDHPANHPAAPAVLPAATVRAWQPGDRVTLQHSRGPRKVKEVLERMQVRGRERQNWPVVVWQGSILWMQGVAVAPISGQGPQITIRAFPISDGEQ